MAAAVFLKDNGYNVLVFEKEASIGGHCDTLYFTPPAEGDINWADLGVRVFQNTDFDNLAGLGSWTLSSVSFVERFAGKVVPLNVSHQLNLPTYGMDLNNNVSLGVNPLPVAPTSPDFIIAFETLYGYLSQYTLGSTPLISLRKCPLRCSSLSPNSSPCTTSLLLQRPSLPLRYSRADWATTLSLPPCMPY